MHIQQAMRLAVLIAAISGSAGAAELVLPVFAYQVPGNGASLWSSEIYVTNTGEETATVRLRAFLPGNLVAPIPCLPPFGVPREVAAGSTLVWTAERIAWELGCAEQAVGGLVFDADPGVAMSSRMVNTNGKTEPRALIAAEDETLTPLTGFGQEIPAVPVDRLPGPGQAQLLPGLLWHPASCAGPQFETNIGLANPGPSPVTVHLAAESGDGPSSAIIDGVEVDLPAALVVPPYAWRQMSFRPPGAEALADCVAVAILDLEIVADGPIAAYGSVIDRSTQDARTVLPLMIGDDATR